jgi:hypothetical protein
MRVTKAASVNTTGTKRKSCTTAAPANHASQPAGWVSAACASSPPKPTATSAAPIA